MSEILLDSQAALDDILESASETALNKPSLTVNGVAKEGVVSEMDADEIFSAGGVVESGGFTAIVRQSDFATKPAKGTPIEARGMALSVGKVAVGTAHYVITAIDPAAE